jgi:prophage maintenance system killer protein
MMKKNNSHQSSDDPQQPLTSKEIRHIVNILPDINRDILEQSDNSVDLEEIGLLFDVEDYEQRCTFIFANLPYSESISSQVAYLFRVFVCSQLFLERNKRTALFLIMFWIDRHGFRLETSDPALWEFIKELSILCPRIPISEPEILSKDALYQHLEAWFTHRIV